MEPYLQILTQAEPQMMGGRCMDCAHLIDLVEGRCLAFPQRIPDDILQDRVFHDGPYPGDFGLRFERCPPPLVG